MRQKLQFKHLSWKKGLNDNITRILLVYHCATNSSLSICLEKRVKRHHYMKIFSKSWRHKLEFKQLFFKKASKLKLPEHL